MVIEEKKLSPTEFLLFFPKNIKQTDVIYCNKDQFTIKAENSLIDALNSLQYIDEYLLCADFIYIKTSTISREEQEDIKAVILAEINEYDNTTNILIGDNDHIDSKIRIILRAVIAPFLARDGGDIELVSYTNGTAIVHFLGKCQGCPYAQKTLKEKVEKNLIHYLPIIREVRMQ